MSKNLTMEFTEVMDKFADQLIKLIHKTAPFDKTFKGRVLEMKKPHKYIVEIKGYKVTASASGEYAVGDCVWVTYPRNKSMNAFIVGKTQ